MGDRGGPGRHGVDPSGFSNLVEQMHVSNARTIQTSSSSAMVTYQRSLVAANDAVFAGTAAVARTWARNAAVFGIALALQSSSQKRDRFFGIPILVTGAADIPKTANHIMDAQAGNGCTAYDHGMPLPFLLMRSEPFPSGWYNEFPPCNERGSAPDTCDEYPFASTFNGGPLAYALGGVSLRLVPRSEQQPQATLISSFYSIAKRSRFEADPTNAIFIALGSPGSSFCTDERGVIYDGCTRSGRR